MQTNKIEPQKDNRDPDCSANMAATSHIKEKKNIHSWGLGWYQTLLSGSCFRGSKFRAWCPHLASGSLSLEYHAYLTLYHDHVTYLLLYCILAILMSYSLRNPVRICVRHVEFVKKLVDKTSREQKENIQTIVGILCVPLGHLPLSEFPCCTASAGFIFQTLIVWQLRLCVFGSKPKICHRKFIYLIALSCFTPRILAYKFSLCGLHYIVFKSPVFILCLPCQPLKPDLNLSHTTLFKDQLLYCWI